MLGALFIIVLDLAVVCIAIAFIILEVYGLMSIGLNIPLAILAVSLGKALISAQNSLRTLLIRLFIDYGSVDENATGVVNRIYGELGALHKISEEEPVKFAYISHIYELKALAERISKTREHHQRLLAANKKGD